jgi:membrane protein required for colicin V production
VNLVDIVIIVILVAGVLTGLRQGFIVEVAVIVGAIVALGVARLEYPVVRAVLIHLIHTSKWVTAISYLIVFLVIWTVIIFIAQKIRTIVRLLFLGWADRLAGAVVGLLQGAIVVELLLYLGKRVPNKPLHHAIGHSTLAPSFLDVVPYISHLFPHLVK